jgi:hypothetical protein
MITSSSSFIIVMANSCGTDRRCKILRGEPRPLARRYDSLGRAPPGRFRPMLRGSAIGCRCARRSSRRRARFLRPGRLPPTLAWIVGAKRPSPGFSTGNGRLRKFRPSGADALKGPGPTRLAPRPSNGPARSFRLAKRPGRGRNDPATHPARSVECGRAAASRNKRRSPERARERGWSLFQRAVIAVHVLRCRRRTRGNASCLTRGLRSKMMHAGIAGAQPGEQRRSNWDRAGSSSNASAATRATNPGSRKTWRESE